MDNCLDAHSVRKEAIRWGNGTCIGMLSPKSKFLKESFRKSGWRQRNQTNSQGKITEVSDKSIDQVPKIDDRWCWGEALKVQATGLLRGRKIFFGCTNARSLEWGMKKRGRKDCFMCYSSQSNTGLNDMDTLTRRLWQLTRGKRKFWREDKTTRG
jgi:hypothetical protein